MINIKNRIKILCLVSFALITSVQAQVSQVTPEVIASGGGHDVLTTPVLGNISVSYTVGECIITTEYATSPFTITHITQGFHQPSNSANTLSISEIATNSSCIGANNGSVMITPVTSTGTVTYTWGPPLSTTGPLVQNLAPGVYFYTISDGTFTINDSVVITENQVECGTLLTFYQGFTPNGDLMNDTWVVDGLEFTKNEVSVFNRWGDLVWKCSDYDNSSTGKVWDGTFYKTGKPLPDATYFYVIEAEGKTSPSVKQTYKGWIELTH